jgi:DNA-binding transcriptional LysR family regulator
LEKRKTIFIEISFPTSFLLVVDTGSMAEAARRLDVTAAAVAQQIRTIERELGTTFGRTVLPTAAGSRIVAQSCSVLRELSDLKISANDEVNKTVDHTLH